MQNTKTDKLCTSCEKVKPISEFYLDKNKTDGHNVDCKICHKQKAIETARGLRIKALTQYGGVRCAKCGEDFFEVLVLDHINGGGTRERRETGRSGKSFLYELQRRNWPPGFQVLCHNCNMEKI
jgi:transcription elongation factor Elf1